MHREFIVSGKCKCVMLCAQLKLEQRIMVDVENLVAIRWVKRGVTALGHRLLRAPRNEIIVARTGVRASD